MGNKRIYIIGAGIAGLSAGCYLQMNGYQTIIFEKNSIPGGLCTSWERKGYLVDGCIHWIVGSSERDNFYNLWKELLDMEKIEFYYFDEFMRFEDGEGKKMSFFTDSYMFEEELLRIAPEDKKLIKKIMKSVRKLKSFKLPIFKAFELYNLKDKIKLIFNLAPYIRDLYRWMKVDIDEISENFKNSFLRKSFKNMFIPEMVFLFLVMTFVWMDKKVAGYPLGGSLNFAREIEERYLELGGMIKYDSEIEKIITKNNQAKGVELLNGKTFKADIVISAADGFSTIYSMLGGKYKNKKIDYRYAKQKTFPSYVQVSLGLKKKFQGQPHILFFPLSKKIFLDDRTEYNDIWVRFFNFDPNLSPVGKTLLNVLLPTYNFKYWQVLKNRNRKKYNEEKARISGEIIDELEKRFGGIKEEIEMIDISTPATVKRYTNNWKGSLEGWLLTPDIGFKRFKKTLPGLKKFYMIGQWVEPGGGIPASLLSGRNVAQILCAKDKKEFRTKTCFRNS